MCIEGVYICDGITVIGESVMKRICVIVLTIVLAFSICFPMSVAAASNTYDISALGLKVEVTIPEEYDVITRDISANSEISGEFERYGIYLKAISLDNIVITVSDHALEQFDLLSDETLHGIISPLKGRYNHGGLEILNYRLCRNSQVPFLEISFTDPARKISALQYYTVYNGQAVSFILYSDSDRLDEKQENTLKDVVNNARISNATTVTEPKEDTEAFQYNDADTGVTFTVPANWKQVELIQEKELADVQFASTRDTDCTMVFGGTDIWGKMSAADTDGHTRADLNSAMFTKADIADFFSISADQVSMVTYNAVQYFQLDTDAPLDIYGEDISMRVTQLVYIDHGWMYLFQFSGRSTHKLYSDFEALLNSVKYPAMTNADHSEVPDQDSTKASLNYAAVIAVVVAVLLAVVPAIVIPVVITRKKRNAMMLQPDYAPINRASETDPVTHTEQAVAGKKCGQTRNNHVKRGLIRIISGIVLLAMEILTFTMPSPPSTNPNYNIGYYIGLYSPAILGITLLIFGGRAYSNGSYSKLILHENSKKIHTVMKWCGFALSTLLFLDHLLTFVASWRDLNVWTILNILGPLFFSVYALFYMYKRPSCLFSAALIFIGVSYIYGIINSIVYFIVYSPEADYFVSYVFTGILPRVAAGVLYIILASIIHKESFSVKMIRVLGWTVFALEILSRVVCNIIVLQSNYFMDLVEIMYLLFVTILMLYLCVFKVNTLRDVPSCVCGKSKFDGTEQSKPIGEATRLPWAAAQRNDKIRFCRKCGERLVDESRFCRMCGTQVVNEMFSPE